MNAFEWVAAIIGIFFVVGIVVGFLIVMALPGLANYLATRPKPLRLDPEDQLDIGPPTDGLDYPEPDDREDPPDGPWWRDAG